MESERLSLWYNPVLDDLAVSDERPHGKRSRYDPIVLSDLPIDTTMDETYPSSAKIAQAIQEKAQEVLGKKTLSPSDNFLLERLITLATETGGEMVERFHHLFHHLDEPEIRELDMELCDRMEALERTIEREKEAGHEDTSQLCSAELMSLRGRAMVSSMAVLRLHRFKSRQQASWSALLQVTAELMEKSTCHSADEIRATQEDQSALEAATQEFETVLAAEEAQCRDAYDGMQWDVLNSMDLPSLLDAAKTPALSNSRAKRLVSDFGKRLGVKTPWRGSARTEADEGYVQYQDPAVAVMERLEAVPWFEQSLQYASKLRSTLWDSRALGQGIQAGRNRISQLFATSASHAFGLSGEDKTPLEYVPEDPPRSVSEQAYKSITGGFIDSVGQFWSDRRVIPKVGAETVSNVPNNGDVSSPTGDSLSSAKGCRDGGLDCTSHFGNTDNVHTPRAEVTTGSTQIASSQDAQLPAVSGALERQAEHSEAKGDPGLSSKLWVISSQRDIGMNSQGGSGHSERDSEGSETSDVTWHTPPSGSPTLEHIDMQVDIAIAGSSPSAWIPTNADMTPSTLADQGIKCSPLEGNRTSPPPGCSTLDDAAGDLGERHPPVFPTDWALNEMVQYRDDSSSGFDARTECVGVREGNLEDDGHQPAWARDTQNDSACFERALSIADQNQLREYVADFGSGHEVWGLVNQADAISPVRATPISLDDYAFCPHTSAARRRHSVDMLGGRGVCCTDYNSLNQWVRSKGITDNPSVVGFAESRYNHISVNDCLQGWRDPIGLDGLFGQYIRPWEV